MALAPLFRFLDDAQHSPHAVRQQDGHGEPSVQRGAGGAAGATRHGRWCCARCRSARATGSRGYVDLVSERAYRYKPGEASDLIKMPGDHAERESVGAPGDAGGAGRFRRRAAGEAARRDRAAGEADIYDELAKDLREDQIVPVFMGAAERRSRRAPAAQGAAPRGARRPTRRRPSRRRAEAARRWPRCSSPFTCARRQAVDRARLARRGRPRA